jgi:hypothetical protein
LRLQYLFIDVSPQDLLRIMEGSVSVALFQITAKFTGVCYDSDRFTTILITSTGICTGVCPQALLRPGPRWRICDSCCL